MSSEERYCKSIIGDIRTRVRFEIRKKKIYIAFGMAKCDGGGNCVCFGFGLRSLYVLTMASIMGFILCVYCTVY